MAQALAGVFVWDGRSGSRSSEPWTIRVEDGRIAALGPDPALAAGAEAIYPAPVAASPAGLTAVPGLIDAHVHLCLDPAIPTPAGQLAVAPEMRRRGAAMRARSMVEAGITTARDLGGGEWLELELRDRIRRGELAGPRLLCAGQPLTTPGGHCHFWGGQADAEAEIAAVIRRQVDHGADWIKIMATGGVFTRGTDIRKAQYSEAALRFVVEQARSHGRSVAAHCHGNEGIVRAARARVRTIEHCSFAGPEGFGSDFDPAVAGVAASDDTWVSPTVNAGWGRRSTDKEGRATAFALRMVRSLRGLRDAGVRFIASTDAGIPGVEHHRLPEGLAAFAKLAGLSPVEVLRTATSESARALELEAECGSLKPGLSADVLVVDGNPLEDLGALLRPRLVLARGRVVARAEP